MYLLKFADCIFEKGTNDGLIIDLNRNYFIKISIDSIIYLESIIGKKLERKTLTQKQTSLIDFLLESEILFLNKNPENFPQIDLNTWDYYSLITNAHIESHTSLYNKIFDLLEKTNTYNVRIDYNITNLTLIRFIEELTTSLNNRTFDGIDLYLSIDRELTVKNSKLLLNLANNYPFIYNVFIKSTKANKIYYESYDKIRTIKTISFEENEIYFNPNIYSYSESYEHNIYFNRKLYVGPSGELKNGKFETFVFTSLNENSDINEILQLIESSNFQYKWKIKKNQIVNCKKCIYSRICIDSNTLIETNKNSYERTKKCKYEPNI